MFVFGNMLQGLAAAVSMALQFYLWILIGRAIVSWVGADRSPNPIVQFLLLVTEPPRRRIQRLLPMRLRYFPLDIAFLALVGLVIFAQYALVQTLFDIGARMRMP